MRISTGGDDFPSTWGCAMACHSIGTNLDVPIVCRGDSVPMSELSKQWAQLWERTVLYNVVYHIRGKYGSKPKFYVSLCQAFNGKRNFHQIMKPEPTAPSLLQNATWLCTEESSQGMNTLEEEE